MSEIYYKRILDDTIEKRLKMIGAIVIEGPKWCGKTTTAKQHAKSILQLQDPDNRQNYLELAEILPSKLLEGEKPRLIDEWQVAPVLWDAVRTKIIASVLNFNKCAAVSLVPADCPANIFQPKKHAAQIILAYNFYRRENGLDMCFMCGAVSAFAAEPATGAENVATTGTAVTTGAETAGKADNTGTKAIAAAVAVGVAAAFGAVAMGLAIAKSTESMARQPEASDKINSAMMLGLVFIETGIIYALIVAILIIFVL